jgi:hypothetical protein
VDGLACVFTSKRIVENKLPTFSLHTYHKPVVLRFKVIWELRGPLIFANFWIKKLGCKGSEDTQLPYIFWLVRLGFFDFFICGDDGGALNWFNWRTLVFFVIVNFI